MGALPIDVELLAGACDVMIVLPFVAMGLTVLIMALIACALAQ